MAKPATLDGYSEEFTCMCTPWTERLSNRYTLSAFLGEDLGAAEAQAQRERFVIEAVRRLVAAA